MTGLNIAKAMAALLISVMIAGVVDPSQFGLVAFAIPLMTLLTLLTDLGLSSAIVRHPHLSRREAGAAVGVMGLAGVICAVLLSTAAPWIEQLVIMDGLTLVLNGFALVTAFSILASAPRALLERTLNYGLIAKVEALALVVGLVVFSLALLWGAGVMSLVAFHLSLQGLRALLFTVSARGEFELNLGLRLISGLARIGGWVFVTNLLSYLARNLDRMLIGGVLGATALGVYGLATQFATIPLILISWPASGVLLSTLSRMQDAREDKARVILATFTVTAAIAFPMMSYFIFGLEYPIVTMYKERWHGLASMIAILAPAGALSALGSYQGAVLVEKGAVRLNFLLSVFGGGTLTAVYLLTVHYGLDVMVPTYTAASVVVSAVSVYFICREASIRFSDLFRSLLPGASAAVGGLTIVSVFPGLSVGTFHDWLSAVSLYAIAVLAILVLQRKSIATSLQLLTNTRAAASFTNSQNKC